MPNILFRFHGHYCLLKAKKCSNFHSGRKCLSYMLAFTIGLSGFVMVDPAAGQSLSSVLSRQSIIQEDPVTNDTAHNDCFPST